MSGDVYEIRQKTCETCRGWSQQEGCPIFTSVSMGNLTYIFLEREPFVMACPNCAAAAYTDLGLNLGDITASFGESPDAIPDSETLVRCDGCGVIYDTGIADA